MDVVPPHYCPMGWNCSFSIQPSLAFVGEKGLPYCCWVGVGTLAPTRSLLILLRLGGWRIPHYCSPLGPSLTPWVECLSTDEKWYESSDCSLDLLWHHPSGEGMELITTKWEWKSSLPCGPHWHLKNRERKGLGERPPYCWVVAKISAPHLALWVCPSKGVGCLVPARQGWGPCSPLAFVGEAEGGVQGCFCGV